MALPSAFSLKSVRHWNNVVPSTGRCRMAANFKIGLASLLLMSIYFYLYVMTDEGCCPPCVRAAFNPHFPRTLLGNSNAEERCFLSSGDVKDVVDPLGQPSGFFGWSDLSVMLMLFRSCLFSTNFVFCYGCNFYYFSFLLS